VNSHRCSVARSVLDVPSHPVLLVHGFASSFELNWQRYGWVDLLQEEGRTVIGVDLLGHGEAPKPHDPAAYADMEARLLEALPADGVVDAVGFSLGAITLIRAVGKAPERFGKLAFGGIGAGNMKASRSDAVAIALENGIDALADDEGENDLARAFTQFAANGTNDPKALAACMRRPVGPLTVEELAKVRHECLVVLGDRDFQMPIDPIVEGLSNATSVKSKVLRGIDHFATPQDFGFLDAALRFLG
jgi:pimeloyl-ACP methyl ester carboxylesterase